MPSCVNSVNIWFQPLSGSFDQIGSLQQTRWTPPLAQCWVADDAHWTKPFFVSFCAVDLVSHWVLGFQEVIFNIAWALSYMRTLRGWWVTNVAFYLTSLSKCHHQSTTDSITTRHSLLWLCVFSCARTVPTLFGATTLQWWALVQSLLAWRGGWQRCTGCGWSR